MEPKFSPQKGAEHLRALLHRLAEAGFDSPKSTVLTDSPELLESCDRLSIRSSLVEPAALSWHNLAGTAAATQAAYVGIFSARVPELALSFADKVLPFMRTGDLGAAVPVSLQQYFSMDFWRGDFESGFRRMFRKPPVGSPMILRGARICSRDSWQRQADANTPLRAMLIPCAENESSALRLHTRQLGAWEIIAPEGSDFDALIRLVGGEEALADTTKPVLVLEEDRGELVNMPLIWNQARTYLSEPAVLNDLPQSDTGPEDAGEPSGLFRQSQLCRFHRLRDDRGPAYWDDDSKGIKFGSEIGDLPGEEHYSELSPKRVLNFRHLSESGVLGDAIR